MISVVVVVVVVLSFLGKSDISQGYPLTMPGQIMATLD